MMKRMYMNLLYGTMTMLLASTTACDDGRIEENLRESSTEEGRVVKLTGQLNGVSTWNSAYSLAVAGYNETSNYAVISKAIPTNQPDGASIEWIMTGIVDEVKTIKLCAIDKLRRSVADFVVLTQDDWASATDDTIRMNLGTLNVGMFSAIQKEVFNAKCVSCHGQSTFAGAGLYLTEGKSYEALVNKSSERNPSFLLVQPEDPDNSFLYHVITENGVVSHDHMDLFSEKDESQLELIKKWIEHGAQQ